MIHQYQLGGYNIVLDSCSGSVHCVDEVAYDMIAQFESASREEIVKNLSEKYADRKDVTEQDIQECYDQIGELKANGQLLDV